VREPGQGSGFPGEPLSESGIATDPLPDDFEGDESAQGRLACLIDSPHASLTQQLEDLKILEVFS
jgi:hypothetical protein